MLAVSNHHKIYYFASIIELSTFKSALIGRPDVLKYCEPIHQICAFLSMRSILQQIRKYDVKHAIVYIESSQHDEAIRRMAVVAKKEALTIGLSMDFVFGGKNQYVPFQAADIVAYEVYKQSRNRDVIRKPIEVLDGSDNKIWSTQFYGDEARKLAEDFISLYDEDTSKPTRLHFDKPSCSQKTQPPSED